MSSAALSSLRLLAMMSIVLIGAIAQTAQVTGTITDVSGAAMPNAQVTATNIATGVARSSVTNEAGNYLVTSLFPGPYQIVVTSAGFK